MTDQERLERARASAATGQVTVAADLRAVLAALDEVRARLAKADAVCEAIVPFATYPTMDMLPDSVAIAAQTHTFKPTVQITIGDVRRAAAALAAWREVSR